MDGIRVLFVADEPDVADSTDTFLEDNGFLVEHARRASDGLARLEEGIDCIVSAYELPGDNGIEFLDAVRDRWGELPFILVVGEGSEELASEAISKGVSGYLQNGASGTRTRLASRIEHLVERHRSSVNEFERLAESIPEVLYRADPETLAPTYVNNTIEEVLGYSRDAWLDNPDLWRESIYPADRTHVINTIEEAREREVPEAIEYRVETEDGQTRWVANRFSWELNTDGELRALVGVLSDVTEPIARDRELKMLSNDIEQLHRAANRLYAAESIEASFEIMIETAVEILGMDWCSLVAPADDEPVFEIKAISEHGSVDVGHRPFGVDEGVAGRVYRTKESDIIDEVSTDSTAKPTDDSVRAALTVPVGEWGVFHAMSREPRAFDERDRNRAELLCTSLATAIERYERRQELEAQNHRLEQFSSIVSHDLRNPLNTAQGWLELAMEETGHPHLEKVAAAHERMDRLIDDLLTFGRVGQAAIELEPVDLATIVEECWAEIDSGTGSLELTADLRVMIDRERVRQLLENLFNNAVDHGGEDVTITVGRLDEGFYVADDGTGIPESERSSAFDPGYTTSDDGVGFGLSIVSEIAAAHDWDVTLVESEAGGAQFEFRGVEQVK